MEKPIFISVVGIQAESRKGLIKVLSDNLRSRGYQIEINPAIKKSYFTKESTDLVFLDNDPSGEFLKIEITQDRSRAKEDETIFALIGSKKFRIGRPEFQNHEMEELTDFLVEQFLKTHLLE